MPKEQVENNALEKEKKDYVFVEHMKKVDHSYAMIRMLICLFTVCIG